MAATYDLLGSAVSDGTVPALTVTGIDQTYDDLAIFVTAYSLGSTGSTTGIMRFNNSSATIYSMNSMLLIDNANQNDTETSGATAYTVTSWPSDTSSTSNAWGYLQIDVPNYTKTNFPADKYSAMTVQYLNNRDSQTTDGATGLVAWGLDLDAAITEVNWVGHYDGGNVNNGGSLKVYGIINSNS